MKRFLIAPLVAAAALFLFGFLFWAASPLPYKSLGVVADDAAAASALAKIFPRTGLYFIPGQNLDQAKHQELAAKGPVAEVNYIAEGVDMGAGTLAKGFLHNFVVSLLVVLMLGAVAPAFRGVRCVVRLCAMLGLVLAALRYSDVIWWNRPISWVTWNAVYDLLSFLLLGLILGKLLAPKPTPASVPAAQEPSENTPAASLRP